MKKLLAFLLLAVLIFFSTGCDLGLNVTPGTVYFYSMVDDETEPSSYRLKQRSGGYTIIMSRGVGGSVLEKGQAEHLKDNTVFTLMLEGIELEPTTEEYVAELGDTGWHVVQNFSLQELEVGTYSLVGVTEFPGREGDSRTNEVELELY